MMRALSVMRSARLMDAEEFMELYSNVRFASASGVLAMKLGELDRLMYRMQPASLGVEAGRELSERELKEFRAQRLREEIEVLANG